MPLAEYITDFLESQKDCVYLNRHGVKFELEDYLTFGASYTLLEREEDNGNWQRLIVEFNVAKGSFLETLQIKSAIDLNRITPRQLIDLHEQGMAHLVCVVSMIYSYCMTFEKRVSRTIARSENNCLHQLTEPMNVWEEYINYTRQYYTLVKGYSFS